MSLRQQQDESHPDEQETGADVPHQDNLNREPGSGSLSRTEAYISQSFQQRMAPNDERSKTNTTFYYGQNADDPVHLQFRDRHQKHRDPDDRRSWDELAKWNDGMRTIDGTRKQANFRADVTRWIQTFCAQLDCNHNQYLTTREIVEDELDLDRFGVFSTEQIILATISLVVDSETTTDPDDFDLDDWIIYRDLFEDFMDDVGMDRDDLWAIRKRVYDQSPRFS